MGLFGAYVADGCIRTVVQKIFCLPYLPHQEIGRLFNELRTLNTENALSPLFNYIDRNWISGKHWTPEDWSSFGKAIRNNNDVEGVHNRWMQRAKAAKLGVYRLSELFHREAELLPVQLKLISHNKLKQVQRASSKRSKTSR